MLLVLLLLIFSCNCMTFALIFVIKYTHTHEHSAKYAYVCVYVCTLFTSTPHTHTSISHICMCENKLFSMCVQVHSLCEQWTLELQLCEQHWMSLLLFMNLFLLLFLFYFFFSVFHGLLRSFCYKVVGNFFIFIICYINVYVCVYLYCFNIK